MKHNQKKSIFQQIKEHPIHSFGQFLKMIGLVIVSVLSFLFSVGYPILMVMYSVIIIALVILNLPIIALVWWKYLIAFILGQGALRLISLVLGGVMTKLQQNLLVSLFGHTANQNEGGGVPMVCVSSFDPKESELLELERKFNANIISEDEFERHKLSIKSKHNQK